MPPASTPPATAVHPNAVQVVSAAIRTAHVFVHAIPETAEIGVPGDRAEIRSAAWGVVPWQVTLAAVCTFSPRAVRSLDGAQDAAPPEWWPAARFAAFGRGLRRVGVSLPADRIAEARS